MPISEAEAFVNAARDAPLLKKRDWILEIAKGKRVLDLGVVDHDVERALRADARWLHGQIEKVAAYLVGIDIDESSISKLRDAGHRTLCADAATLRLDETFDVVVCGDLIEHVTNPLDLLNTIAYHLGAGGRALISAPNPLSLARILNIWADGSTRVNPEHVFWFCPQTIYQLVSRSDLAIDKLVWLVTDYPARTRRRLWGRIINSITPRIAARNKLLSDDFGVEMIRSK